jgi:uncharacterized membrane protein YphA (DoxX/SURF4 family)
MDIATLLPVIGLAARICLAIVFVTAAIGKLRHLAIFEGVVANYRILPRVAVKPAALALPWAELAVGASLLAPGLGPTPCIAAVALLAAFAGAMAVNLVRGRAHIDCGCHRTELRQTLRWSLVVRNLVLGSWLLTSFAARWTTDLSLVAVAIAAGAAAYLFYLLFNVFASLPAFNPLPARKLA